MSVLARGSLLMCCSEHDPLKPEQGLLLPVCLRPYSLTSHSSCPFPLRRPGDAAQMMGPFYCICCIIFREGERETKGMCAGRQAHIPLHNCNLTSAVNYRTYKRGMCKTQRSNRYWIRAEMVSCYLRSYLEVKRRMCCS